MLYFILFWGYLSSFENHIDGKHTQKKNNLCISIQHRHLVKKYLHLFIYLTNISIKQVKIYLYSHNTQNKLFLSNKSHKPNAKA